MTTNGIIDYPELVDSAMRAVVREVLRKTAKSGLPGDHHFYITFRTNDTGVKISEALKSRYPQEMTIVLQHQFWDFRVEDQQFFVTLSFSGVPERLVVPFLAMTAFADPNVKFGLQFRPSSGEADNTDHATDAPPPAYDDTPAAAESSNDANGNAKVISLDTFRKK